MLKWNVGDVTITSLIELDRLPGMNDLIAGADRESVKEIAWLRPHFATENGGLKAIIQSMVVETPDQRILVDTCVGNDKNLDVEIFAKLKTPFLEKMAAAGFARESIDTVLCTHLHVDHVGWNTMLEDGKWVPTFPNARYLFEENEYAHWLAEEANTDQGIQGGVFAESVKPVMDAGLVDLVTTDLQVCDEVRLVPTPGHTPGHVSILVQSQGQEALITGDFVHHPCQMARMDWGATVDFDGPQAVETRKRIFAEYADRPVLIIGSHFAAPTAGHLKRDGDAYRLEV